jgi:Fic family protein
MEIERFSAVSPGHLVRIPRDPMTGNDRAFVPASLPPDWEFPNQLWPLLADAKQQLGILEGITRNLPNPGILLRPLEDREALQSSKLEGTYVTATELLIFEMQPKESNVEDDPVNQRREVFNYRKALQQSSSSDLPLSLRLVRELHKTLMSGVRGKDRTPGKFRTSQVAIGSNHRFVPPPPERLMDCLDPLERYFHVKQPRFDRLVECFLIHYQFETIHPFSDGNGRVGRLLLAIMLKEFCGLSRPWLYMSEYYEKHREEYAERLFNVSASADWTAWIEFCLKGTANQAKEAVLRCDRLLQIRDSFMQRMQEAGGTIRLNQIVENIFVSPFARIVDVQRTLNVSYPTAKSDLERLEQAGILSELPDVSPKTYYAPEVFNAAYAEMG